MAKKFHSHLLQVGANLVIAGSVAACSPSISEDSACRLPSPNWARSRDGIPHLAIVNRILLGPHDELQWNGVTITESQLQSYLRETRAAATVPFTIFDPDPAADCITVRRIRQLIDTSFGCNRGRCGEGRDWGHASGVVNAR